MSEIKLSVKARLKSKLAAKLESVEIANLSETIDKTLRVEDHKKIKNLLVGNYDDGNKVDTVKIILESGDKQLLDQLFDRIRLDFMGSESSKRVEAIDLMYQAKLTQLTDEFNKYVIGVVNSNIRDDVLVVIDSAVFSGDRALIQIVMDILPKNLEYFNLLLGIIPKSLVEMALAHFSQKKYSNLSPNLRLLSSSKLNDAQATDIINDVTYMGLLNYTDGDITVFNRVATDVRSRLAKKLVSIGFDTWKRQTQYLSLEMLVLLLLHSEGKMSDDLRKSALTGNYSFNHEKSKIKNRNQYYEYFIESAYLVSLMIQLKIPLKVFKFNVDELEVK